MIYSKQKNKKQLESTVNGPFYRNKAKNDDFIKNICQKLLFVKKNLVNNSKPVDSSVHLMLTHFRFVCAR